MAAYVGSAVDAELSTRIDRRGTRCSDDASRRAARDARAPDPRKRNRYRFGEFVANGATEVTGLVDIEGKHELSNTSSA